MPHKGADPIRDWGELRGREGCQNAALPLGDDLVDKSAGQKAEGDKHEQRSDNREDRTAARHPRRFAAREGVGAAEESDGFDVCEFLDSEGVEDVHKRRQRVGRRRVVEDEGGRPRGALPQHAAGRAVEDDCVGKRIVESEAAHELGPFVIIVRNSVSIRQRHAVAVLQMNKSVVAVGGEAREGREGRIDL